MKIFYIIGKSASGKDHIFAALKGDAELNLSELILYTTRPMRAGEIDGETYHFVDESRLIELRREGRVIEERTYDTVYGPWTYATVDEDIDLQKGSYIAIGTLESFVKLRDYYGTDRVVPLYIEVSDENLLLRAMKREKKQDVPLPDNTKKGPPPGGPNHASRFNCMPAARENPCAGHGADKTPARAAARKNPG